MNGNNIADFKIKLGEKLLLSILDAIYFVLWLKNVTFRRFIILLLVCIAVLSSFITMRL